MGILEAQQDSVYSTDGMEQIVAEMRAKAGEIGCDGVIIQGKNDAVVGGGSSFNGSGSASVSTLKGYQGTCIMYTGPAATSTATTSTSNSTVGAGGERACVPNSTQLCYGAGACRGAQACQPDGMSYGVCDCGTSTAGVIVPTASSPTSAN